MYHKTPEPKSMTVPRNKRCFLRKTVFLILCILRACCLKYMARQTHTSSPFYSSQLCYSYLAVPTFLQTRELVIIDILDMAPSKATSESCDPFWFLKERCQVSDEHMCRKKEQLCVCGLKAVYKKHVSFSFHPQKLKCFKINPNWHVAGITWEWSILLMDTFKWHTPEPICCYGFPTGYDGFFTGSPRVRKNVFFWKNGFSSMTHGYRRVPHAYRRVPHGNLKIWMVGGASCQ